MTTDHASALREHGIYVTAPRLAVLRAIDENPHASASTLVDAVRADIGSVSRQSVQDTLETLTALGMVRQIQPMGSPARYESRTGDNHHHVICRDCGAVEDVDCAVSRRPCLTASESHGYAIDEAEVLYWGTCPRCQRRPTRSRNHEPSTTDRGEPR